MRLIFQAVWAIPNILCAVAVAVTVAGVGAARAATDVTDLVRVLRIDDLAQALHEEGLAHGQSLDADMLEGRGGAHWAGQVARIYGVRRIATAIREALAEALAPGQLAACIAFFDSPLGQEILSLELAARVSMRDSATEAAARAAYQDLRGGDDARLVAVTRFVAVNDLIERNVAGAMSANFQFLRGMADGEMLGLDEGGILDQVWNAESETRDETESWLFAYLLMAYRPLAPEQLERYIAFSESPAGQALNAALFAGFDDLYQEVSLELGQRIAAAMKASDI
ncbi:DUF2059 domain-containing protein [Antarcticimicrobium luteum]|uniref:DUF2059 domain-containing protein n=1 Tax=Antarcticimicrobium luteum TaxID=2547397 RepID=A0A4R5V0Q7_9RHOB|nr:DUF2059 domain-containing protein [Antarcticimicrobium luteum]TDK45131.1 DUF2059 domain-containing protein [Antarcticimicrobium luteum]